MFKDFVGLDGHCLQICVWGIDNSQQNVCEHSHFFQNVCAFFQIYDIKWTLGIKQTQRHWFDVKAKSFQLTEIRLFVETHIWQIQ